MSTTRISITGSLLAGLVSLMLFDVSKMFLELVFYINDSKIATWHDIVFGVIDLFVSGYLFYSLILNGGKIIGKRADTYIINALVMLGSIGLLLEYSVRNYSDSNGMYYAESLEKFIMFCLAWTFLVISTLITLATIYGDIRFNSLIKKEADIDKAIEKAAEEFAKRALRDIDPEEIEKRELIADEIRKKLNTNTLVFNQSDFMNLYGKKLICVFDEQDGLNKDRIRPENRDKVLAMKNPTRVIFTVYKITGENMVDPEGIEAFTATNGEDELLSPKHAVKMLDLKYEVSGYYVVQL